MVLVGLVFGALFGCVIAFLIMYIMTGPRPAEKDLPWFMLSMLCPFIGGFLGAIGTFYLEFRSRSSPGS